MKSFIQLFSSARLFFGAPNILLVARSRPAKRNVEMLKCTGTVLDRRSHFSSQDLWHVDVRSVAIRNSIQFLVSP